VLGRGKLLVILWWNRGELWSEDDVFLSAEKHANFKKYFCGFPVPGSG
jgi:hypothetical protein